MQDREKPCPKSMSRQKTKALSESKDSKLEALVAELQAGNAKLTQESAANDNQLGNLTAKMNENQAEVKRLQKTTELQQS